MVIAHNYAQCDWLLCTSVVLDWLMHVSLVIHWLDLAGRFRSAGDISGRLLRQCAHLWKSNEVSPQYLPGCGTQVHFKTVLVSADFYTGALHEWNYSS